MKTPSHTHNNQVEEAIGRGQAMTPEAVAIATSCPTAIALRSLRTAPRFKADRFHEEEVQ